MTMVEYFIGVDLGQKRDYTAVAIVEQNGDRLCLRHLEHFKLNTSYKAVADRIQQLNRMIMVHGPVTLLMDATGVGLGVLDDLESRGLKPIGITITSGRAISTTGKLGCVPKRDLVVRLLTDLRSGRLEIASSIPDFQKLIDELLGFRVQINRRTGQESFGAEASKHDDFVLSLALACWGAQRGGNRLTEFGRVLAPGPEHRVPQPSAPRKR
jgi:phage FluMu gp28-like protein